MPAPHLYLLQRLWPEGTTVEVHADSPAITMLVFHPLQQLHCSIHGFDAVQADIPLHLHGQIDLFLNDDDGRQLGIR